MEVNLLFPRFICLHLHSQIFIKEKNRKTFPSAMIDENYGPQHKKHFSYNYLVLSTIKSTAKLFMKIYYRFFFYSLLFSNKQSLFIGKVYFSFFSFGKFAEAKNVKRHFFSLPVKCIRFPSKHIKTNKNKED